MFNTSPLRTATKAALLLVWVILLPASLAQAEYELEGSFSVTDGQGGSFRATKTGSLDGLENSTGTYQSTGTFTSFVLLNTNPVVEVAGVLNSAVLENPETKAVTLNGSLSLSVGVVVYPVVFNNLVVTTAGTDTVISGTVTVAGFPIAVPKGHIAETIVITVAELLD